MCLCTTGLICYLQGFDEFMNLVIDDAVEVKQALKVDDEKRRELGASLLLKINRASLNKSNRANPVKGG